MKLKISLSFLVALAIAVVGAFLFILAVSKAPYVQATGSYATNIAVATTSAVVAVTSNTQILASSSNPLGTPGVTSFTRVYATICNNTANPVFISINGDKPTATGVGTAVIAGAAGYNACFEVTDRNLTQGSIRASSTVASTNVSVTDYVQ